jgi:hypothetical protein
MFITQMSLNPSNVLSKNSGDVRTQNLFMYSDNVRKLDDFIIPDNVGTQDIFLISDNVHFG